MVEGQSMRRLLHGGGPINEEATSWWRSGQCGGLVTVEVPSMRRSCHSGGPIFRTLLPETFGEAHWRESPFLSRHSFPYLNVGHFALLYFLKEKSQIVLTSTSGTLNALKQSSRHKA